MIEPLQRAREESLETIAWVAGFEFPEIEADYRFVALSHPDHYASRAGRVVSSDGIDATPGEFADVAVEDTSRVVGAPLPAHAVAIRTSLDRSPATRLLNGSKLPKAARDRGRRGGSRSGVREPVQEHHRARRRALLRLRRGAAARDRVRTARAAAVPVPPRAHAGAGATEAPRGMLLQRYELDAEGTILSARIMPPTSQNQLTIESDVRQVVASGLELGDTELTARCELAVRNHASVHLVRGPLPRRVDRPLMTARVVVAGIGNAFRRDDGAGPAVARVVAASTGAVDMARSASPSTSSAGGRRRTSPSSSTRPAPTPRPARSGSLTSATPSTGRARARTPSALTASSGSRQVLRRAPARVVVIGIEGEDFSDGEGLSPAVGDAVPAAARRIAELIAEAS